MFALWNNSCKHRFSSKLLLHSCHSGWILVTPLKPCLVPNSACHSLFKLTNLPYSTARKLLASLGWRTRTCLIRPAESTSASCKSKVNFTTIVVFGFLLLFFLEQYSFFFSTSDSTMKQVQYLANHVKMENSMYILSNEMLKFIYIHMKLLYKYFALFEIMSLIFSALFKDLLLHCGCRCHSFFWEEIPVESSVSGHCMDISKHQLFIQNR